jgi:hypothetical protein
VDWPSLKAQQLLRVLKREPLAYEIEKTQGSRKKKGTSHRKLVSRKGYPDLGFAFHDRATIPGGKVKDILIKEVGLTENEARKLV